jgi:hypothetical protein
MPPSKNSRASSCTNHSLVLQAHRSASKSSEASSKGSGFRLNLTPHSCTSCARSSKSPAAALEIPHVGLAHFRIFVCSAMQGCCDPTGTRGTATLTGRFIPRGRGSGGEESSSSSSPPQRPRFRPRLAGKWGRPRGFVTVPGKAGALQVGESEAWGPRTRTPAVTSAPATTRGSR